MHGLYYFRCAIQCASLFLNAQLFSWLGFVIGVLRTKFNPKRCAHPAAAWRLLRAVSCSGKPPRTAANWQLQRPALAAESFRRTAINWQQQQKAIAKRSELAAVRDLTNVVWNARAVRRARHCAGGSDAVD